MNFKVISDGCCDITPEVIAQYDVDVVPFYISFDYKNYYKEIEEIDIREVYERMVGNPDVIPKTSLPSVQDYADVFKKYVKDGIPVICLCFTPALSGSYNSACNAKEVVCEEYPDAKISVINTEAGTVSQYVMVIEAGRMQQAGISFEQATDILERMKKTNRIFFTVGNLDYLKAGGRIGKLTGLAADVLNLKPMIILLEGENTPGGVARGRKASLQKAIDLTKKHFEKTGENPQDYAFAVGWGYDVDEGLRFVRKVEKEMQDICPGIDIIPVQIGATIAVHTGPFEMGIGCVKRYEHYL